MATTTEKIPTWQLLNLSRTEGTGDALRDVIATVAFFMLLRWAEQQEREQEAITSFEGREYRRVIPQEFSWNAIKQVIKEPRWAMFDNKGSVVEIIPYLINLQGSPLAETVSQAAHSYDARKLSDRLIETVFEFVKDLPFETPSDFKEANKVLNDLLNNYTSQRRDAAYFTTPKDLVELMLEIANPQPGETVYNPCFGVSGLLSGAASRMVERAHTYSTNIWSEIQHDSIYGVEQNDVAFLIGLVQTVLSGVSYPRLEHGNALERDIYTSDKKFDVILANPPIGAKVNERWLHNHYPIKSNSSENLFLQHIMHSLKPNGRAIVCLPEGILFRGGADKALRERLLSDFAVEAVISLKEGYPFTSTKTNLLIFRKADAVNSVWFQKAQPSIEDDDGLFANMGSFDPQKEARIFRERIESETTWYASTAEIGEREFDLSVKQVKTDELQAFIKELEAKDPRLKIATLDEIAAVFSGVSYKRRDVVEESTQNSVPLIRVSEISKKGELKSSPLHFPVLPGSSIKGSLRSWYHRILVSGDLLISSTGTIGKVARVGERHAGAISASGVVTVRLKSNEISPLYLNWLLQSAPYQKWFADTSVGAVIKHLSLGVLKKLPIPIPRLDIQQAIVASSSTESSPSELVKAIFAGAANKEFLSYLLYDPDINTLIKHGFIETDDAPMLGRIAAAIRTWRNKAAHEGQLSGDVLSRWLFTASSFLNQLVDAVDLSEGAEQLALFGIMQTDLTTLKTISNEAGESIKSRLQAIANAFEKFVADSRDKLINTVNVTAELHNAVISANEDSTIRGTVWNRSALPLRHFKVVTSPDAGEANVASLGSGAGVVFTINVPPRPAGTYPISVRWNATRFDGIPVNGEIDLICETVVITQREDSIHNLGESPYIVGTSVDPRIRNDIFFGREDLLAQVRRTLRLTGPSTVILLEGNRRTGKTSFLKKLTLPESLTGWIPVYINLQECKGSKQGAGIEVEEIFYSIAREIILEVQIRGYSFEILKLAKVSPNISQDDLKAALKTKLREVLNEGSPFETLDWIVGIITSAIDNKRIVLLIDEFDKIQEGIENKITHPQVLENLRSFFHKNEKVSGILAGALRLKRLREDHWSALFGIGKTILVDALDVESARRLVTEPIKGRLVYTPEARDMVLELTCRQPYLIQSLCDYIFGICADSKKSSVTIDVVEDAATTMVETTGHFRDVFNYISNPSRQYIAAVINRNSDSPELNQFEPLSEKLQSEEFDISFLAEDLKELQELDVVKLEQHEFGAYYKIKVPLFSRWLSLRRDIQILKQKAITS